MKNFKRLVGMVLVLLITVVMLSGCGGKSNAEHFMYDNSEAVNAIVEGIEVIEGEDSLVYYKKTKAVYIMIVLDSRYDDEMASFFAPYISENGKYCRYIDGSIVEIN